MIRIAAARYGTDCVSSELCDAHSSINKESIPAFISAALAEWSSWDCVVPVIVNPVFATAGTGFVCCGVEGHGRAGAMSS